ncbi:MAG: hypothetical protein GW858_09340 [Sphingomonadales bacterium]|nr:hypothetical protein [Sphingomonadales bacterium]NCQ20104.1 hypothetical protein [Sphingomonadales bacterium]NCT02515.1 hypothetical protein [Sphingomonadales bacterium]
MGEWLGIPEWLAVTIFAVTALTGWLALSFVMIRRAHRRVAVRRPNPTETEFLAMMAQDCSPDAARFLWAQTLSYVEPRLTPHPDDLLLDDLCIDDGDVTMDWPQVWAERQGLPKSDLPDWPKEWPLTVRNFARWLDLGRPIAAE